MSNFGNNARGFFARNWKLITYIAGPIILLVIIFSLPLAVVAVDVTETYVAKEIQSQPYVSQETYQENESYTDGETRTETVYDAYASGYKWSYSFMPRPDSSISVSINGVGYAFPPYVYWADNTTGPFFPGSWFNFYGWNSSSRIVIKMTYPVVKYRLVSRTRDVIKYKDVEVPVQKERLVTKSFRLSLWAYFFMDRSKLATMSR